MKDISTKINPSSLYHSYLANFVFPSIFFFDYHVKCSIIAY